MVTPRGLARRVDVLEQAAGVIEALPCTGCGLAHVYEALSLDRISAVHMGEPVEIPEICGCACCEPVLRDLAGRFTRTGGAT